MYVITRRYKKFCHKMPTVSARVPPCSPVYFCLLPCKTLSSYCAVDKQTEESSQSSTYVIIWRSFSSRWRPWPYYLPYYSMALVHPMPRRTKQSKLIGASQSRSPEYLDYYSGVLSLERIIVQQQPREAKAILC